MEFKIVLIGDFGCGKTTLLKRLRTGEFTKNYSPTLGVEVSNFVCNSNYGEITFKVWDTAGQEKFGGLREGYYLNADGALVFANFTSEASLKHAETWERDFLRENPGKPTVLLVNKVDLPKESKVVSISDISQSKFKTKFTVSAKSNFNYDKGFIHLAREITGHPDLEFTESEAIAAPIFKW